MILPENRKCLISENRAKIEEPEVEEKDSLENKEFVLLKLKKGKVRKELRVAWYH